MKKGRMESKEKIAEELEKGVYFKKLDETNITNQKILKGVKDKRKETFSEGSPQEECKVCLLTFQPFIMFLSLLIESH